MVGHGANTWYLWCGTGPTRGIYRGARGQHVVGESGDLEYRANEAHPLAGAGTWSIVLMRPILWLGRGLGVLC